MRASSANARAAPHGGAVIEVHEDVVGQDGHGATHVVGGHEQGDAQREVQLLARAQRQVARDSRRSSPQSVTCSRPSAVRPPCPAAIRSLATAGGWPGDTPRLALALPWAMAPPACARQQQARVVLGALVLARAALLVQQLVLVESSRVLGMGELLLELAVAAVEAFAGSNRPHALLRLCVDGGVDGVDGGARRAGSIRSTGRRRWRSRWPGSPPARCGATRAPATAAGTGPFSARASFASDSSERALRRDPCASPKARGVQLGTVRAFLTLPGFPGTPRASSCLAASPTGRPACALPSRLVPCWGETASPTRPAASMMANTTRPMPSAVNDKLVISRPWMNRGKPVHTNMSGSAMDSPTCTLRWRRARSRWARSSSVSSSAS